MRITRIVLRPRIEVVTEASDERLLRLAHLAHDECFIANSLTTEIVVEPTFVRLGDGD